MNGVGGGIAVPSLGASWLRAVKPLVLGVAFAALLQFVLGAWMGPFYTKLLLDAGIAVVLAVSLNIVNGYTGQFSLGHAAFMAAGGYTAGAIVYYGSFLLWHSPALRPGLLDGGYALFAVACLAGGCVAALLGYLVGLPSLRLRGDYLAIVTLGFGEIVRVLLQRSGPVKLTLAEVEQASWGTLATSLGGALGFTGLPFYTNLFAVWTVATVALVVAYRLKYSSLGRAFLAIREDEIAAEAMGVPVARYKVRAFVIAAFFAGIAGGLFAHEVGVTLSPRELGFMKSIEIVIMVVLGGMGSISGAFAAAVTLSVLPEVLRGFADYRLIVYALLLISIMILRPQGLFGIYELWDLPWLRRRSGAKP